MSGNRDQFMRIPERPTLVKEKPDAIDRFERTEMEAVEELVEELKPISNKLKINGENFKIDGEKVYKESPKDGDEDKFVGSLDLGEFLGGGSYGKVYKMQFNNHVMAMKETDNLKNPDIAASCKRELEDLSKFQGCSQIVKYFGSHINIERFRIFMELMDTSASSLLQIRIKALESNICPNFGSKAGFPEPIMSKIALEMVKGLDYMKSNHRIIHADIHPGNVLFDRQGNIKLCDFGVTGRLNDKSLVESIKNGAWAYMAPERIRVGIEKAEYGSPADVWSLGIILFYLAQGKHPYLINTKVKESSFQLKNHMKTSDTPALQQSEGFSLELCEFVEKCLQKEPKDRIEYSLKKHSKYDPILVDPFIEKAETTENVAKWVNEQLELEQKLKEEEKAKKEEKLDE